MAEQVQISHIGHRGDGIGETPSNEPAGIDAEPVFVPYTLAGETVTIERTGQRGRLVSVDRASPDRVKPVCRHFQRCGGCALQMMSLDHNRALKRRFVADALAQQAIDVDVDATIGIKPGARRRAVLAAIRTPDGILLGYHERQSNRVVDIAECPVLVPAIAGKLDALRTLLTKVRLKKQPVRLTILATDTGLDVDVANIWPVGDAGPKLRAGLVALCQTNGIARLTLAGELAVQLADPQLMIAGTIVKPQPGAFAQAAADGETILSGLVTGHLAGGKVVADLFSGFGTFTLALAKTARVHAVEVDRQALAALEEAVRHGQGLKQVTSEPRDLLRFPLSTQELKRFDGVVFDPPRSGARAQAEEIAASTVRRVAAISCNPATFARDSRILIDGGFSLTRIVPVDQFVYSAETEIAGLFSR